MINSAVSIQICNCFSPLNFSNVLSPCFLCVSVCLSVHPSGDPSVHMFFYLSIHPFIIQPSILCPFPHQPIHLSIFFLLSDFLSVYLSISINIDIYIYIYIYVFICISVYLLIHPSPCRTWSKHVICYHLF